jgi:GlcNAc-P-P-Und epimerase
LDSKEVIMTRVFVTGGSGFIGTNLIQSLIEKGNRVINYDIRSPRNVSQNPVWVSGDILELGTLVEEIGKFNPEYFIHLAARTDLDGASIDDYSENTVGVRNAITAIEKCSSVQRSIFASSRLVCKIGYLPKSDDDYCPNTYYGESKVRGEQIVKENSNKIKSVWAIFRPTSIWGPWFGTPYKEFFFSILRSQYIHPKESRIFKSFGYVGNSVHMLEQILTCDPSIIQGKTFYLADYPPIEVKAWADLIAKKNGTSLPREVPKEILYFIAFIGDCLKLMGWKHPPLTTFRLNNLIAEMLYDTSVVEQICGELPYSVSDGVENTLEWIRAMRQYDGS